MRGDKIENIINNANSPVRSQKDSIDPISELIKKSNARTDNDIDNVIGYNTEIGNSRFDSKFHSNLFTDLEDFRSKEQHWSEKVGKGLGRTVNKIGVELAKIPGYVGGGMVAAANEIATGGEAETMDTFVNNAWIKAIEGYEESMNENVLPVYVKKAVREGNLWTNATSIDFWSKEGADGLGFMLSMLVPGAAASKLGTGSKLLGKLGKVPYGKEMLTKIDDASRALGFENAAAGMDIGLATITNTIFEAGSEANSAMKGVEQKEGESDGAFARRKGEIGRNVFVSNLAILALPNAILNRNVLGRMSPSKGKGSFLYNEGKITSRLKDVPLKNKILEYTKILSSNITREGFFEEGMQSASEAYWQENDNFDSKKMLEQYIETLGTVEGQKAVMLGSLFGSVAGITGKVLQDRTNNKRINDLSNIMSQGVDLYEKSLGGIYKKDQQGNIVKDGEGKPQIDLGSLMDMADAQSNLQKRMDILEKARENGDTETVEYLTHQLEAEISQSFIKAGEEGIELLEEKLRDSKELIASAEEQGMDPQVKIGEIVANARSLMREVEFFNTYGISKLAITAENKQHIGEFKNRLNNLYIKNVNDLKFIGNKISKLTADKQSLISSLSESLDADNETELETNVIVKAIDKKLDSLIAFKKELKSGNNDLLSKKGQNRLWNGFLETREKIEEVEEEIKEEKKEEEKQQESQEKENVVVDTYVKEEKKTFARNEVKQEVNDIHSKISDIVDNIQEDTVKGKLPGGKKEESLNKGGSAIIGKEGTITYPMGVDNEDLLKVLPQLENVMTVKIIPSRDKDGNIGYKVIADGKEIPLIKNYNVDEEKEKVIDNDYIDENITNLDTSYNDEYNKITARETEAADVTLNTGEKADQFGKNNKPIIERKHVKIVKSSDTLFTSPNFVEFLQVPRDKTGERVNFQIGTAGDNLLAEKAILLYNEIIYENKEIVEKDKGFLVNYLPIRTIFGDSVYSQLFFKNDKDNSSDLSPKELELRKKIVDNLVNKVPIDNLSSKISFQFPGWVQNDKLEGNIPASNSILELQQIDNDIDKVDLVYSNKEGQLMTIFKKPDNELKNLFVKSKNKGSMFIKLKAANNKTVPLKLNIRRVNDVEADLILAITDLLLNPNIPARYQDRLNLYTDLYDMVKKDYKEDIMAIGASMDTVTLGQLLSSLIYKGSTIKNFWSISGEFLRYGAENIDYNTFSNDKDNIKLWLTSNKNRNIQVSKLKEKAYKKHLLKSKILSTDLILGEPVFQDNTDIYIDTDIDIKGEGIFDKLSDIKEDKLKKQPARLSKSKKKKNKLTYKDAIKKIEDLNKGEDSNTIC